MKKFLPIMLVGVLVISGFGTLAINAKDTDSVNFENILQNVEIDFSSLKIVDFDKDSVEVFLGEEEIYLMNPGQPMIPRIIKSFELPFGAYNIKVKAVPSEIVDLKISKEIRYSPAPLPLSLDLDTNIDWVFDVIITFGTAIGAVTLIIVIWTRNLVPLGIYLYGVVYWSGWGYAQVFFSAGGYLPIEFIYLFTIGVGFIFVASIIGMLSGSG